MIFKKMNIERVTYGADKGKVLGQIYFDGEAGSVCLNLTPDLCDKLFLICAEGIIKTAKEAANNLLANCIEHKDILRLDSAGNIK